jgi:hypothetical protein
MLKNGYNFLFGIKPKMGLFHSVPSKTSSPPPPPPPKNPEPSLEEFKKQMSS